jgi:sec-independent protein translocase protein TatA
MGTREILIILVIALLIFGTKKLRSLGSDLGAAVRDFKKSMSDGEREADAKPLTQQLTGQPPEQLANAARDADFPASDKAPPKPEQKTSA